MPLNMILLISLALLSRLTRVGASGSFDLDVDIHTDSAPILNSRTHLVSVGGSGASRFDPNHVNASIGDIVRFNFLDTNHTATQSSLERPCNPSGGFDTGYMDNVDGENTVDLLVTSTAPEWFYSRQSSPKPCGQGTIFAINPDQFWPVYIENAKWRPRQTAASYFTFNPTSASFTSEPTSTQSRAATQTPAETMSIDDNSVKQWMSTGLGHGSAMTTGGTAMSTGLPIFARSGLGCTGYGTTGGIATAGGSGCSSNSTAQSWLWPSQTPVGDHSLSLGAATQAAWPRTQLISLIALLFCML